MRWIMKRRGEISMEVIIIAAIALLVLVILSVLLLRGGGTLNAGTQCTSPSIGGECVPAEDGCQFLEGHIPSSNSCSNPDDICCVPLVD